MAKSIAEAVRLVAGRTQFVTEAEMASILRICLGGTQPHPERLIELDPRWDWLTEERWESQEEARVQSCVRAACRRDVLVSIYAWYPPNVASTEPPTEVRYDQPATLQVGYPQAEVMFASADYRHDLDYLRRHAKRVLRVRKGTWTRSE